MGDSSEISYQNKRQKQQSKNKAKDYYKPRMLEEFSSLISNTRPSQIQHQHRHQSQKQGSLASLGEGTPRPRVEEEDIVARLWFDDYGKTRAIILTYNTYFVIGRYFACDLVLRSNLVSLKHLQLHAVRTDTSEATVCLQDLSSNGFKLNGYTRRGNQSVVLCHGDEIRIPGTEHVFSFEQSSTHRYLEDPETNGARKAKNVKFGHLEYQYDGTVGIRKLALGDFDVYDKPLGSGSYGVVNLAENKRTRALVACKVITKITTLFQSGEIAQSKVDKQTNILQREVEIGLKIKHPNLNRLLEVIEEPDRMYLVLELVTGGDLFSYLDKRGSLHEDECKFHAFQLMQGMDYLHKLGYVHRDLKTENILILPNPGNLPRLLITDYGLAHPHQNPLSRQRTVAGTIDNLAPEVLRMDWDEGHNKKGYDGKLVDCWCLGIILYICLCGSHPFTAAGKLREEGSANLKLFMQEFQKKSAGDHVLRQSVEQLRPNDLRRNRVVQAILLNEGVFQPRYLWDDKSEESIDLIRGLLHSTASGRMSIKKALESKWIQSSLPNLRQLYRLLVTEKAKAAG